MNILAIHIVGFILIFLTISLQIALSKKKSKIYGLILPLIAFIFSICLTISFKPVAAEVDAIEKTAAELGLSLEISKINDTIVLDSSDIRTSMMITFLSTNVWTVVLLFVYAMCRTTGGSNIYLKGIERSKKRVWRNVHSVTMKAIN